VPAPLVHMPLLAMIPRVLLAQQEVFRMLVERRSALHALPVPSRPLVRPLALLVLLARTQVQEHPLAQPAHQAPPPRQPALLTC